MLLLFRSYYFESEDERQGVGDKKDNKHEIFSYDLWLVVLTYWRVEKENDPEKTCYFLCIEL